MEGGALEEHQPTPDVETNLNLEIKTLETMQDSFKNIISEIQGVETEDELLSLEEEAQVLKSKSQEMIVLLRVMMKIRTELAYTKLDLEKAKKTGAEIGEIQKRVNWLEKRLHRVLLKSKSLGNSAYDKEITKTWMEEEPFDKYICQPYVKIRKQLSQQHHTVSLANKEKASKAKQILEQDTKRALTTSDVSKGVAALSLNQARNKDIKNQETRKSSSPVLQILKSRTARTPSPINGSPTKSKRSLAQPKEQDSDAIQKYWTSDHHRFEDSKFMKSVNPLSWHTLPIACNDTFLEKDNRLSLEIPVKEGSSIKDIVEFQRKSFNKLLKKMEVMYNALDEASDEHRKKEMDNVSPTSAKKLNWRLDTLPIKKSPLRVKDETAVLPPLTPTKIPKQEEDNVFPRSPAMWSDHQGPLPVFVHRKKFQADRNKLLSPPPNKRRQSLRRGSVWDKRRTLRRAAQKVRVIAKFRMANRRGSQMPDTDELKWRRIKDLLGPSGVASDNDSIALDAIKCLAQLGCCDNKVIRALILRVEVAKNCNIAYEASKALLILGTWHSAAVRILTLWLKKGHVKWQSDVLQTLRVARDAQFVDQHDPDIKRLSETLLEIVKNKDEQVAFNAALTFGHMCIVDPIVKNYLLGKLKDVSCTVKAEALVTLIKQMNCKEKEVIEALFDQIRNAINWKHRAQAAELLNFVGPRHIFATCSVEYVFTILEELLWNHPNRELRCKISGVLDGLGLKGRARAIVAKRLEDVSETNRAHGITAMASLGIRTQGQLKTLLDLLELDPSLYVRTEVIRAFSQLEWQDDRVIHALEDKEKGEGPLAKEAKKALKLLKNNTAVNAV